MKTAIIFFLIGAICGALSLHIYNERQARLGYSPYATVSPAPSGSAVGSQIKDTAGDVKDSVARKLRDWKLTPDDIRDDLARTGEVVRTNAAKAGEKIADGRIVAVIKSKYILDRDLSALDINVDCKDSAVTLSGVVASPELIGRAIVLALDTGGVTNVVSKLSVAAPK